MTEASASIGLLLATALVMEFLVDIEYLTIIRRRRSEYWWLVYTKTVDSVKRARWLARQTRNILHYLPPSKSGKMASRFVSVASEEIIQNYFFVVYFISLF